MIYDELLKEADSVYLTVKEKPLRANKGRIKGKKIAIKKDISTVSEKACVLAEELGHYFTSHGDIFDQTKIINIKQEKRARNWAYEKLVPLHKLIRAYEAGVSNRFELALYLDVIEEFLECAIEHYREKYGLYCIKGNYIIYFEPLGVYKSVD